MQNKEIGGYIEFETYHGQMLHDNTIALNCGRSCLAYLIKAKKIRKISLPYFLCSSVQNVCRDCGTEISFYHIDKNFRPVISNEPEDGEWLYIVNYYGQISDDEINQYKEKFRTVILDNAQNYFHKPICNIDTIYSCKKFFGVPDGAFLYTDAKLAEEINSDESFERIHYILGRYERSASEFYNESSENNKYFANAPMKRMSKLTFNLLHSFEYDLILRKRTENFRYLHSILQQMNMLDLIVPRGAFMYPLYVENGAELRKKLQAEKIYIPVLWPDVFENCRENDLEYKYADNILPIPVDQRYTIDDMDYIISRIRKNI